MNKQLTIKAVFIFLSIFSMQIMAKTTLVLWHSWVENKPLWQQIQQEFNVVDPITLFIFESKITYKL